VNETVPTEQQEREEELLELVRGHFKRRGLIFEGMCSMEVGFARGFVDDWFEATPDDFTQGTADTWAEIGPLELDMVHFDEGQSGRRSPGPRCKRLAESANLRYLYSFTSRGDQRDYVHLVGEGNFAELFGRGPLINLRRLVVRDQNRSWTRNHLWPIGDGGLAALAANPALAKLSYLKLWWAGFGNKGLKALAASEHLRSLRVLSLADKFSDAGVKALARSPLLDTVEVLHLNAPLTSRALLYLLESPHLKALHTLDLTGSTSGGHQSDGLDRFGFLRILDDKSLPALASSDLIRQLRVLRICDPHNLVTNWKPLITAAPQLRSLKGIAIDGWFDELKLIERAFEKRMIPPDDRFKVE
jgi:hypothetical protein